MFCYGCHLSVHRYCYGLEYSANMETNPFKEIMFMFVCDKCKELGPKKEMVQIRLADIYLYTQPKKKKKKNLNFITITPPSLALHCLQPKKRCFEAGAPERRSKQARVGSCYLRIVQQEFSDHRWKEASVRDHKASGPRKGEEDPFEAKMLVL